MASAEIETRSIHLNFDREEVLKSVNLKIHSGENFVLVGPSGYGKSVLMKVMAGLLSPTEGQVLIGGVDLYGVSLSEQQKIMKNMGMLFQKNALFDSMTCAENIAFPLREVTNRTPDEIAERVKYFLDAVGISHAADLFPDEISGGMQKRLGIARALALDPKIIFYDDATAGLDPITSRKIVDLIMKTQKTRQATVVSITNDMNRAYQMADRIGIVLEHEIIVTGSPAETQKHPDPRVQQFITGALVGPLTSYV